jgi:uncharacterized damage-inducible protein DinB
MHNLLTAQYNEVKGAREALFNHCHSMGNEDMYKTVPTFNNSTIASLLTHNANTYLHWLCLFDKSGDMNFYETPETARGIEEIYQQVNVLVSDFLSRYKANYMQPITQKLPRRDNILTLTPLQLFTHTITHEFHHKGQILTMGRLLGYTPPDTDIIRF